ncbi:MAG: 6-phosphogluconolactonase [Rhodospirillales bacterium]
MIRRDFPDAADCAQALAEALAHAVFETLQTQPRATLALSGGRSPEAVLPVLAAKPLDWARVDVTLVDDRRVPEADPASNAGLVRRLFLDAGAGAAAFHPLWTEGTDMADVLADTDSRLTPLWPADVAYLGMGPDGHVASLFPADDAAAFENGDFGVIYSEAPSAPHRRIGLTMVKLIEIESIFLHVTGAAKIRTLEDAVNGGPTPALPVSLLLHARPDVEVFAY